jgi:invasion protein IalB
MMYSAKTLLAGVACMTLVFGAASAVAQAPGTDSANPAAKKDPNRIVCEKIQETGSRLNSRKVCMTAQQWEEQRRRDRENLQDAQQRSLEPNSG